MFKKPRLPKREVDVKKHSGYPSDTAYLENAQKIALASLETQHEALEKSLILMWKTMLLSGIAVVVAVVAVLIAIFK